MFSGITSYKMSFRFQPNMLHYTYSLASLSFPTESCGGIWTPCFSEDKPGFAFPGLSVQQAPTMPPSAQNNDHKVCEEWGSAGPESLLICAPTVRNSEATALVEETQVFRIRNPTKAVKNSRELSELGHWGKVCHLRFTFNKQIVLPALNRHK